MRKRGFNMYLTKGTSGRSLYRSFTPKFAHHREAEAKAYVGSHISRFVSQNVDGYIKKMTADIASGISGQGK